MIYLIPIEVKIPYKDDFYVTTVYMRHGEKPTREQIYWLYNEYLIETGQRPPGETGGSIVKYTGRQ